MSTSSSNPATQTLQCEGAFEVFKLTPGVFQADEIKRQYRRLALILHPDKNRHKDAEAAFKKLTAAFEKLIDPTQQAACRIEATRRRPRQNDRGETDYGDRSGRRQGPSNWEFPRWCKEGEYVPEKKTEDSTPDAGKQKERPMEEFMAHFAQEEAVFKEQVAEDMERVAEKKRAKAEARAAADQERIDRLREDILGGAAGDEAIFEAKTASWQKFSSGKTRRRSNLASPGAPGETKSCKAGGARVGAAARASARESNESGIVGESPHDQGNVGDENQQGKGESGVKTTFACMICRRGFKSAKGLARHEAQSELHRINVELRELMSTG